MDENVKRYLDQKFESLASLTVELKTAQKCIGENQNAINEHAGEIEENTSKIDNIVKENAERDARMKRMESSMRDLRRRGSKK